ncbi:hypothetical protein CR513_02676, partial [Mucuna pruriens]
MIGTQIGDMVLTLHKMYLIITKDTNHHIHLDNNRLCNVYSKIRWRIWSSKWLQATFRFVNTNWSISHHYESITNSFSNHYEFISKCKFHNLEEWEGSTTIANSENIVRVVEVVAIQPPLPSIAQPLKPPVITSNKLQAEQKERLLQDLKKLRDFYEHLAKHSTLRFLLKKPLKDVPLEFLRWMRLPQATIDTSGAKILDRLSEVIDRYSQHGVVEVNLKAWTNSSEPPQSPPGSSANILYDFDPKIELTLRRIRKVRNTVTSTNSSCNTSFTSKNNVFSTNIIDSSDFFTTNTFSSLNDSQQQELMENQDRTLKELATPDVVYQPWCIEYPQLELAQSYELKSDLIHLLPKFHGLASEDPHKHLKEFHVVCSTMRPQGIPEDYIKMKAFPFSLDGAAKNWLYLQLVLFNT